MEEVLDIELDYAPRDVFADFHDRTERWAVVVAHRRCGKTVSCINDLIYRALIEDKEHGQYAYVAPYYSQAKNIAWDYLQRYSKPVMAKANQSELWVELVNGAKIKLYGADNPDALRGLYLDGVVLDEYADMRPRMWGEIIRPLLADRMGWAVFIGTPKGHNAFYDVYTNATKDNRWFAKTLRASQTKLLPDSELQDAQASMSPDQYEQEFECSFEAAIMGAFYGKEMRVLTDANRITTVEYDKMFPCHTAWDLGFNDPTPIIFFQIVGQPIRIIDCYENTKQGLEHYAKIINQKQYTYGRHIGPHDIAVQSLSTGISRWRTMYDLGIKFIKPSESHIPHLIEHGIEAVRRNLPKMWIDEKACAPLLKALENYRQEYDEKKRIYNSKPRHDWSSHFADSMRYLCGSLSYLSPSTTPEELDMFGLSGVDNVDSLVDRASRYVRKLEEMYNSIETGLIPDSNKKEDIILNNERKLLAYDRAQRILNIDSLMDNNQNKLLNIAEEYNKLLQNPRVASNPEVQQALQELSESSLRILGEDPLLSDITNVEYYETKISLFDDLAKKVNKIIELSTPNEENLAE